MGEQDFTEQPKGIYATNQCLTIWKRIYVCILIVNLYQLSRCRAQICLKEDILSDCPESYENTQISDPCVIIGRPIDWTEFIEDRAMRVVWVT